MFIGRQHEQEQVLGWLHNPGLVTLRGPPGAGKSALASRIAAQLEAAGWRVLRASMLGVADAQSAVDALLRAAGRKSTGDWVQDLGALVMELREPQTLALVDDLEGEAAIGVIGALEGTAECTLLVCAHASLGLRHERVLPVEPLPEAEAATLLVERVERAGGSLCQADARVLVGRASGLPLVLELLAPQVAAVGAGLSLAALRRDGLDARLLSRAFARASARLGPKARDALGALGALEGDFTAERALAVIGDERAFDHFLALCQASWVWRAPSGRFQLLPSVRDFARPLAAPEVRARRCAAVLASLPAREDDAAFSELVADRDELEAAWRLALEVDEGEALGRLALAADLVHVRAGPFDRHLDMLTRSLRARSPNPEQRLRLHFAVGRAHALRGLHRRALPAYAEARALMGDPDAPGRLTATCAALMAFSLRPLGRLEEARGEARRALACAAGDLDRLAAAEMALGVVELGASELALAEAAFSRAAALARLVEAPRMEGLAHANLALTHLEAGQAEAAGRAAAQARACLSAAGDSFQLARVLHMEGRVHLPAGYDCRPTPVVVGLHYYTGTAQNFEHEVAQVHDWLDVHGVIGIFPNAMARGDGSGDDWVTAFNDLSSHNDEGPDGATCTWWAADYGVFDDCPASEAERECFWGTSCADDVGFVRAVLEQAAADWTVDPDRIHLTGFSQGAIATQTWAYHLQDVVASVAPLHGFAANGYTVAPPAHVSMMQVWGTYDYFIDGWDEPSTDGLIYDGAAETAEVWAEAQGCSPVGDTPYATMADGKWGWRCTQHDDCDAGTDVVTCQWDWTHDWGRSGADNFMWDAVWEFFEVHPRR